MSETGQALELLDLPLHAVAVLRATSASAGINPPGWVVQLLVLLASSVLLWCFWRLFKARRSVPCRTIAAIAGVTSLAVVLSILWTFIDRWRWPPTGQVHGSIVGMSADKASFQLLDIFDKPMGRSFLDRETGKFVVSYKPIFGEPARTLMVQANGCEDAQFPLNRRQLQLGEALEVSLTCGLAE